MKTYQIYIDSANSINAATGGNVRDYKFDWNILPEGEYEMTFSFMSQLQKLTLAEAEATTYANQISISVPFSRNDYEATTTGFSGSTHLAGVLEIKDQQTTATHTTRLLVANTSTNSPVSIRGKPQGMDFQVTLLAHTGVAPVNDPNYNMIISLKHLC